MKNFYKIVSIFFLFISFSSIVIGENLSEEELRMKVKNRQYPGGADEEDLKVQVSLVSPERTINIKKVQSEILDIKIDDDESDNGGDSNE